MRMADKSMQWVWKPFSESLGDDVSIFTHTMPDHYHQPQHFRVDALHKENKPIVNDQRMAELRRYILDDATHFRTNRLMIPWGDDFFWSDAQLSYKFLDETIEYWNNKYDDITLL